MTMTFHHMSGAGNTFLVADGRTTTSILRPDEVRAIVADHPRADGLPIEGVLVLRSNDDHSFAADFYNPDGSHGMMCGNGARCIVRFATDNGVRRDAPLDLALNGAPYHALRVSDEIVRIDFPAPVEERRYAAGELAGVDVDVTYVNVQSDHAVITGPLDPDRPVVATLRHHPAFPRGVNVNMADADADGTTIRLATFERGVEAVTGACGTGALSTALAFWRAGRTLDHVRCIPPSGRPLDVTIHHTGTTVTGLTLQGDARYDDA
jgi:diaminopimelate epimerase